MGSPQRRSAFRPEWLADYLAHPKHGPLPALLITLTVSTGIVDAVSILALGRVFVANMTGNIVFIGFGLAGSPGFSLQASATALAAFLVGAGVGGAVVARFGGHRGLVLRNAVASELLMLGCAAAILARTSTPYGAATQDFVVAFAGAALGLQNAAVRSLAVPDLTTTVLTMTLTGIAADVRSRDFRVAARRAVAVTAMLTGAVAGALLVLHSAAPTALAVACGFVAVVLVAATITSRRPRPWQQA